MSNTKTDTIEDIIQEMKEATFNTHASAGQISTAAVIDWALRISKIKPVILDKVWVAEYKAPYHNTSVYTPNVYANEPDGNQWISVPIQNAPTQIKED